MTQIGNLIAVLVPDEYNKFKISGTNYLCGAEEKAWQAIPPRLDDGYYNIIGTINLLGEFDFDCEEYVDCLPSGFGPNGEYKYRHYGDRADSRFKTKEESFISLLNSKGILLDELNNQKILILEKI